MKAVRGAAVGLIILKHIPISSMFPTLLVTASLALLLPYTEGATIPKCDPGQYLYVKQRSYRRRRSIRSTYSCQSCTPGHYMDLYRHTQESCPPCPSKMWTDVVGATSCKGTESCPAGSQGPLAMTAPGAQCTLCEAGKIQPHVGSGTCHNCYSGSYADGLGKTTCTDAVSGGCPAGKFGKLAATSVSETTCSPCGIDTYSAHPGESVCIACEKGRHQPMEGGTTCTAYDRCGSGTTLNTLARKCVTRHAYLGILRAVAWTTWVVNFLTCCANTGTEEIRGVYGPFMGMNVFIGLGIGIESTRSGGGRIGEPAFWTMVAFQAIGTLALVVYLVCIAWKSCPKCNLPTPPASRLDSGKATHVKPRKNIETVV